MLARYIIVAILSACKFLCKWKRLHLCVPRSACYLNLAENSGSKTLQRYFQSYCRKSLFKTLIRQYPLRRGMRHLLLLFFVLQEAFSMV